MMGTKGSPNILTKSMDSLKGVFKFKPNSNSVSPEDIGDKAKVINFKDKKKQITKGVVPIPEETYTASQNETPIRDCSLLQLPMRVSTIYYYNLQNYILISILISD